MHEIFYNTIVTVKTTTTKQRVKILMEGNLEYITIPCY